MSLFILHIRRMSKLGHFVQLDTHIADMFVELVQKLGQELVVLHMDHTV